MCPADFYVTTCVPVTPCKLAYNVKAWLVHSIAVGLYGMISTAAP